MTRRSVEHDKWTRSPSRPDRELESREVTRFDTIERAVADIAAGRTFDITTLSVAVREVRELLEAARQDQAA